MKKNLCYWVIVIFFAHGCGQTKTAEKNVETRSPDSSVSAQEQLNVSAVSSVSEDEIIKMAEHYIELVQKHPGKAILQINMDGAKLIQILKGTQSFKLIATADEKDEVGAYVQLKNSDKPAYYNINSFFNESQAGMGKQRPICPPPSLCEPLAASANPEVLLEDVVSDMAKEYTELIATKSIDLVLQINMDVTMLKALLYKSKRLKLIVAAANVKGEKKATVVMQFWNDDLFFYYDINDIFNEQMRGMNGKPPLCPPPPGCDLPLKNFQIKN